MDINGCDLYSLTVSSPLAARTSIELPNRNLIHTLSFASVWLDREPAGYLTPLCIYQKVKAFNYFIFYRRIIMTTINCPGTETFRSTKTRTSTGVFTKSNRRAAASRAQTAVLNDLTNQVNQAVCEDGCLKVVGQTNAPASVASCRRIWWTFWIVIRCRATATGSVVVKCEIQG